MPYAGARHQRVELVPQAEVDGQIAADLPAIAHVPAELPLAAGRQDVLQALVGRGVEAQQERRIAVVLVRAPGRR